MIMFNEDLDVIASKWNDKEFVQEQLIHHLDEVDDLINKNDTHLLSECIDLINILNQYCKLLSKNMDKSSLKELVIYRYNKFISNKNK